MPVVAVVPNKPATALADAKMEAEQARLVVESRQLREEMQARARAKAAASACRCLARCARSMQMHAWAHWLARNDAMMRACGTIGRSLRVVDSHPGLRIVSGLIIGRLAR